MNELLVVHPVHQWIILIIVLQIQEHNEKECPRAELKCPFHVVGCAFEGTRPAVNEHVKDKMLSHLMDLTKEFGALKFEQPGLQATKSRSRRTRGGVEAQEQASEGVLFNNLEALCHQQRTEIDGLRRLVNEMTGTVERLERRLNESRMRVETPLQELSIRLVICYVIHCARREQPSLLLVLRSLRVSSVSAV